MGVDVGFENPVFACLEMDYEEADADPTGEAAQKTQQTLTFYELDLGLNHVVRKYRWAIFFLEYGGIVCQVSLLITTFDYGG